MTVQPQLASSFMAWPISSHLSEMMKNCTLERFGTFPKVGDSFRYENLTVTVLAMDGRRVERVLVQTDPDADKDKDKDA